MKLWALKYAKLGLSVIPLKEKNKEPLYKWAEFQQRRATVAEIENWWHVVPNANIGIVTGKISNLAVIDLDGDLAIQKAKEMGLHSNVISISGNGRHLWYQYSENLRNSASKIAEGIDVRGEGGFIVAPPSIHPNGKRYRFVTPLLSVQNLPPFPVGLLNTIQVSVQPANLKEEHWIEEALEEFQNGHVHNNLVSILGKFRAHNFPENAVFKFLLPYNTSGEMSNEELRDKITEIFGRYEPIQSSSVIVHRDIEEDESVEEFLKEEEPTEWFSEGIFAKNSIGFVAGLPESGKTWAMMDLAIEVAIGGNWLGLFPVKKSKVLFIDQERARPETKRRFEALFKAKDLSGKDLEFLRIKRGSSIKIDLETSYNSFSKLIDQRKPDLIIIDSLATFHTKEGNNAMEIQSVMEKLKVLRDKFNTAFLFVHHLNKNEFQHAKEGQEPDIGLLAGSIAIPAAAETVFIVRKRLSGESTVYHCKSTMAKKINPFEFKVEDVSNGIEVKGLK